jgi:hypothetical protein|tara:strand:+ start:4564 stop:4746 length:183 start_codon:yes stop_codon:yes gene_type:complete
MRNKENLIRICDKIEGIQQNLLFILKRPNASSQEFVDLIEKAKEEVENLKMYIGREPDTN